MVCPIVSDIDDYAEEVVKKLQEAGLYAKSDLRNEKINYKVREHSLAKVPVIAVVGAKEKENGTVTVRRLGSEKQETVKLDDFVAALVKEAQMPHLHDKVTAKTKSPPETAGFLYAIKTKQYKSQRNDFKTSDKSTFRQSAIINNVYIAGFCFNRSIYNIELLLSPVS